VKARVLGKLRDLHRPHRGGGDALCELGLLVAIADAVGAEGDLHDVATKSTTDRISHAIIG
jgi:hypothetical protein